MLNLVIIFLVIFGVHGGVANSCDGKENSNPIYDKEPTFVKEVKNGKMFKVGSDDLNSTTLLLQLSGSDYEMGYAYGQLLDTTLQEFLNVVFVNYFQDVVKKYADFIPQWIIELIEKYGLFTVLDIVWMMQKPYVDPFVLDIMKGLADGAVVDLQRLYQYNVMPSILHAGCTIIGSWGDSVVGGKLKHIRALDLGPMPILLIPTIVTYKFDDSGSNHVSIMSGPGYIGMLSAFSTNPKTKEIISWSEKVWGPFLPIFEQTIGAPWNLHMFQAMRYGKSVEEIVAIYEKEKRTSSIYSGLGITSLNEAFIIKYAIEDIILTNSLNQSRYSPGHPFLKDMIYLNKHEQPSHDDCTSGLLQKYYGKLTPELYIEKILPVIQTGDLQDVVFDHGDDGDGSVYFSHGIVDQKNLVFYKTAYDSQFVKVKFDWFQKN